MKCFAVEISHCPVGGSFYILPIVQHILKSQDWKIDRLLKENHDLEDANADLMAKLAEIRTENLEVRGFVD